MNRPSTSSPESGLPNRSLGEWEAAGPVLEECLTEAERLEKRIELLQIAQDEIGATIAAEQATLSDIQRKIVAMGAFEHLPLERRRGMVDKLAVARQAELVLEDPYGTGYGPDETRKRGR